MSNRKSRKKRQDSKELEEKISVNDIVHFMRTDSTFEPFREALKQAVIEMSKDEQKAT